MTLHGVAGALYQSVFWAAVCKNLPNKFEGIAISFVNLANNVANAIIPIIIGHIVGDKITKISAKYCMILLIGLSSLGLATS